MILGTFQNRGPPNLGRQKGVTPICSDLRSLFSGIPRFVPICSDSLRFLPISFQNNSGKPADPFCKSPIKTGGKQTGDNDICVATGIALWCWRDARCRQGTGKRLSRAIWPSFNKERMSHLCDSAVAGLIAWSDNVLASKREYPLSDTALVNVPDMIRRIPTGACNYAPFSEGFLEGFSRLHSRRF